VIIVIRTIRTMFTAFGDHFRVQNSILYSLRYPGNINDFHWIWETASGGLQTFQPNSVQTVIKRESTYWPVWKRWIHMDSSNRCWWSRTWRSDRWGSEHAAEAPRPPELVEYWSPAADSAAVEVPAGSRSLMTWLERLGQQVPLAVGKQLAAAAAGDHIEPPGTSLCSLPEDTEEGCWS